MAKGKAPKGAMSVGSTMGSYSGPVSDLDMLKKDFIPTSKDDVKALLRDFGIKFVEDETTIVITKLT